VTAPIYEATSVCSPWPCGGLSLPRQIGSENLIGLEEEPIKKALVP
jgi:hypothetical protein